MDGVDVLVGVVVEVGVAVLVAVEVLVGIKVGVLLGRGVIVTTWTGTVDVGVADTTVAVAVAVDVNVLVGKIVPVDVGPLEPGVLDGVVKFSRSTIPAIVRVLEEVKVREPIGIRLTIGL